MSESRKCALRVKIARQIRPENKCFGLSLGQNPLEEQKSRQLKSSLATLLHSKGDNYVL